MHIVKSGDGVKDIVGQLIRQVDQFEGMILISALFCKNPILYGHVFVCRWEPPGSMSLDKVVNGFWKQPKCFINRNKFWGVHVTQSRTVRTRR